MLQYSKGKKRGFDMMYKAAIIGGGAAGLAAAVTAAHMGLNPVLVEAQSRVGRKLLSTGNGRCNLTNREAAKECYYHGEEKKAAYILRQMPPEKILDFFQRLGLPCRELAQGRIYPSSLQAASVLDTLWTALTDTGTRTCCDFFVKELKRQNGYFQIIGESGQILEAKQVLLCTGGKAAPSLGGNGSGLELARKLGHRLTAVKPGLTGILCPSQRAKPLKGARNSVKAVLLQGQKVVATTQGEVQFSEQGLSGICIQELSRWISEGVNEHTIALDLLPDWEPQQIQSHLLQRAQSPSLPASQLLCNCMNRLIAKEIARLTIPKAGLACQLTEYQLKQLGETSKNFCFPVTGAQGWNNAQVMVGGVSLQEVDPSSMASLRCPNLYFAGEILNVDGDCGGFNLHWAWATGILAAKAMASKMDLTF